jgi:hypothetical protein
MGGLDVSIRGHAVLSGRIRPGAALCALALLLALVGLPAGTPTAARAQAPGDVVRVTAAGQTGRYMFREVRGGRLVLSGNGGGIVSIPVAAIQRLEVRTRDGRDGIGTVLLRTAGAAVVGASAGLLVGWSTRKEPPPPSRWCFEFPAGQWCYTIQPQTPTYAEEGAIMGAVAGGAVGLIYGVLARRWTWRPVAVRDLTVQVAPAGGRLGVGVRWQP